MTGTIPGHDERQHRAEGRTRPIAVVAALSMVTLCAVALPLMATDGLDGLAIGMAATAAVSLVARSLFLMAFFDGFQMLGQLGRAAWPVLPAVALVLMLRAVEGGDRTLAIALGECVSPASMSAAAARSDVRTARARSSNARLLPGPPAPFLLVAVGHRPGEAQAAVAVADAGRAAAWASRPRIATTGASGKASAIAR